MPVALPTQTHGPLTLTVETNNTSETISAQYMGTRCYYSLTFFVFKTESPHERIYVNKYTRETYNETGTTLGHCTTISEPNDN